MRVAAGADFHGSVWESIERYEVVPARGVRGLDEMTWSDGKMRLGDDATASPNDVLRRRLRVFD